MRFRDLGVVDGSIAVLARLEQMLALLPALNCGLALCSSFDEYVDDDRFTPTGTDESEPLQLHIYRVHLGSLYLGVGQEYLIRNERSFIFASTKVQ